MPDTTIDTRLLEEACRGNSQAFARLADAHYKTVYGIAFSTVGNWSAAQDIAQETFLLAWSRRESLRNALAFPAWVRRIAANLAKNWIRSAQYRRRLAEHYQALTSPETAPHTAPDMQAENVARNADVWQALQTLSPPLRESIVLYYLHGETLRGVSQSLGISENAAKKRLQHGRAKLRSHFEERWKAEMAQARTATSAHSARDRFLAALVIGPAMPEFGKSAASAGLGLWWEVTKQTALTHKALTGVAMVSAKKVGVIAATGLLLAGDAYWATKKDPATPPATTAQATVEPKQADATPAPSQTPNAAPIEPATERTESRVAVASKPVVVPIVIANPADYITLRGRVVDEAGQPMPGVDVSVAALGLPKMPQDANPELSAAHATAYKRYLATRGHYWNAVTDENGDFTVSGIRFAGSTLVTARAPGYTAKMKYLRLDETGVYPETITLQMEPGVTIRGRLLSVDGQPVTDGSVKLEGFATESGAQGGVIGLAVFTDESGYFELDVDSPGVMSLSANSELYGVTSFSSIVADPEQELVLTYPPDTAVFGRVTDERGGPVPNVEVRLEGSIVTKVTIGSGSGGGSSSHGTTFSATTAGDGAYRIARVDPSQRYGTSVFGNDDTVLTKGKTIDDLQPGANYELNLTVQPQMVVSGTVYGAQTGRPLEGIVVVAVPADTLNPSARPSGPPSSFSATSAADGTYGITVSGEGGLYALTSTYSASAWMHDPAGTNLPTVSLEPGETVTQDLRVAEPVTRAFLVVDAAGAPIEGADLSIQVRSGNGMVGFSANARSDIHGRVTLSLLPPDCDVMIHFSKTGYLRAQSAERTGTPGQVYPEERVTMHRAAGFTAVLVGADGQPIAEQEVTVTGLFGEQGQIRETARTSSTGALALHDAFPATEVSLQFSVTQTRDGESVTMMGAVDTVSLGGDGPIDLGTVSLTGAQQ